MITYFLSRGVFSLFFGGLFFLLGAPLWLAGLISVILFVSFVLLLHSGRYVLSSQDGAAPLRRDERGQAIADKAGRNAWVLVMLTGGILLLYYGLLSPGDVPVVLLGAVLMLGAMTYFLTDLILRRI